jgi:heptosyltransferase I
MRIAIVKLSALGDIVHSMVVLQFIKNFNNEILIDWFVDTEFKELLENNGDINHIYTVNLKKAKKKKSILTLLKELTKLRKLDTYDIVIDLQGLIKSGLISKLIPSNKTIGFNKQSIREILATMFYTHEFNAPYSNNVIERNIELVSFALGITVNKKQIEFKSPFLFSKKKNLDFRLSSIKKNIILIPGASHISKCIPVIKLADFSKLLDANFIVIWGSKNEKLMANELRLLSPKVTISNKLSLGSLVKLISMSDLVIGPDSGPTHFAWALNVPSITLFGPTPGYRNAYETSINKIVESDSIVNPMKINKDDISIKDLDINEIYGVARKLLNWREI